MENPLIVFGANLTGYKAADICMLNQVEIYGFLDDDNDLHGRDIHHIPVLGGTDNEDYVNLLESSCEYFIAEPSSALRKKLSEKLIESYKKKAVNIIHPAASVSVEAHIGHGNLIEANTSIAIDAKLGDSCIINLGASIDSGVRIGDYCNIGANSVIAQEATVEDAVFIGENVTIVSGITIGKGASIGAGSVVVADVKPGTQLFGNPAQEV